MGRKLALLIGNGMYEKLPRLKKHRADVKSLAQVLRASDIGAFDDVRELTDKSANTIKQEIEKFFIENKKTDDLLLLYLTGHGEMDKKGWEGDKSIPLSTFTYYLVQGLTTGAADRDKDGVITVDEWFDYTDEQVRNERSDQTPRKDVRTQRGRLVIAYNPTWKSGVDVSSQSQGSEIHLPIPTILGDKNSESTFPWSTFEEDTPQTFSVGGRKVNIIILARGYYGPQEVQCFYDRTQKHLPPDLEKLRRDYEWNNKEQKAKGLLGLPYNSPMYKLLEFDLGHRNIIEGEEVPNLRLKFSPTDYFSQIVTDLNVGNPVREKYRAKADLPITDRPIPEFSTILGVNLNVITADNYLVITERSRQANVAGGKLHTSVGENLLRPRDSGVTNAPDPFLALTRGAKEELGIALRKDDIVFKAFTVIPDFCQYSLIATLQIPQTHSQVDEIWHNVVPADKWESRRLLFHQHHPDTIAQFVTRTWERWFHVALAAVVLSLVDVEYTWEEVDRAFLEAWSKLSL